MPWKIHQWLPVALAMPRMLKEFKAAPPEVGFLGAMSPGLSMLIQYWRSFDHLERYARAPDRHHWPAWVEFNRRMKKSRGDVASGMCGRANTRRSIAACRRSALAKAGRRAAVTAETDSARQRLGVKEEQ